MAGGAATEVSFMRSFAPFRAKRSYGKHGGPVKPRRGFIALLCFAIVAGTLTRGTARAADRPVRIVVLGDSLSAGLGLSAQNALPAKLQSALNAKGYNVAIENAGVSGDTASGGLGRLDWSVPDGTDAVIVELGANDALRGLDPKLTRAALEAIIERLKARRIAVMLAGMLAPRNLGEDYAKAFDPIYPELAAAHDLVLYPFILDGVAGDPALNQADGLHPTAAGVDVMVARMLPKAEELLARVKAAKPS
jgi:acyl-CoA thioesterase-1